MSDAKSGLELTLDEAAKTALLEAQWRSETGGRGASPFSLHLRWLLGFPDSSVGKEFACNARDPGLIPGSGRSAGERIATHYSVLGLPLWLSWYRIHLQCGRLGLIPELGRAPGEGKGCPLQYSGLENSTNCIVHGVSKSQTQLSDFHSLRCPFTSYVTLGNLSVSLVSSTLKWNE